VDAPTSGTLLMALSGGPGREGLTTPTDPGVSDALLRGRTVESICQPADPRCAGVAQCLRGTWTLDNAHALEQIRRRGAQVTNLRGRLTLAIDDACGAVSTATRFCLENDAGGARFRAVVDGTITGTLSAAEGVARGSEARNDLQITSEVQVGGRWLRTPVPLGASRSALGGLGGLPSSVRYTCTETLLTLQNPDGSSAIYRR